MDLEQSESKDRQRERYLRVLRSGSVKEKAMMIGNHLLDVRAGEKVFLSQEDIVALVDSIRSDKDIAVYKRYRKMFAEADQFLLVIAQCKLNYLNALHEVDKLLIMAHKDKDLERITNDLLEHISDTQTKRRITSDIVTNNEPYLKTHGILSTIIEGHYMNDKDWQLVVISNINKNMNLDKVKNEQVRLKTAIQAIKDFMTEKKFKPREFLRFIKRLEEWIKKDKNELLMLRPIKSNAKNNQQTTTEPDYDTTEINSTLYKRYREGFLHG